MSIRDSWETQTHEWKADVDTQHLQDVRARACELGLFDIHHLILEVLAYADDEAEDQGSRGKVEIVVGDGWVSVSDNGRGTDTRFDDDGRAIRKPIMATRDVRFFDSPDAPLLPDGLPRRGMSAVAAVSPLLVHVNRRKNGNWRREYAFGVPQSSLENIPPDGTTGTTVEFHRGEHVRQKVDQDRLARLVLGFKHLEVTPR